MKRLKNIVYLIGMLLGMLLLMFVGTAIVQFAILALSGYMQLTISEHTLYEVSGSSGVVIASLACGLYVKSKNLVPAEEREKFSFSKAVWYLVFSVSLCKILVETVMGVLLSSVFPTDVFEADKGNLVEYIFAIIIAPVFEELLFRYGLYNLIKQKFSHISSMLVSTFIFAVIHGYQIQGFVSCFAVGVLFTLIYVRTKNITYSIVAHMACNAFAAIMNALAQAGMEFMGIPLQYDRNGYSMLHPIIVITALAICGLFFYKRYKTSDKRIRIGEENVSDISS